MSGPTELAGRTARKFRGREVTEAQLRIRHRFNVAADDLIAAALLAEKTGDAAPLMDAAAQYRQAKARAEEAGAL